MKTVYLLFLIMASRLVETKDAKFLWVNDFDKPLHFTCPDTLSISGIISEHSDKYEDRRWDFRCRATFGEAPTCFDSGYVNNFDRPINFMCPSNYAITGMSSYHDDKYEDRRWSFTCCTASKFCTSKCKWSGYVNHMDGILNWHAGHGYYLTGTQSYHEDSFEDRRWKYLSCKNIC